MTGTAWSDSEPRLPGSHPPHAPAATWESRAPDLEPDFDVVEQPEFAPVSAWRLFVQSGSGRLGLALFGGLILISVWVLVTYPSDFGTAQWSNPSYWANNPRNAPPVWAGFLGQDSAVPQSDFALTEPGNTSTIPAGEVRQFDAPYRYESSQSPTSLLLTLSGVTFQTRPPAIQGMLTRPDGGQIRLGSVPIRGPRPNESPPFRRFYDVPERISLGDQQTTTDAVRRFFANTYPDRTLPPDFTQQMPDALFAIPAADGSGRLEPLHGDYTIRIQTVVADQTDEIAPMTVTVGGTAFGLMGTDGLGRDLWRGLLYGFPVALLIAALTSLLSTVIGASLGIWSGFSGGLTDSLIQRSSDIVSNVPTLPLLIFLVAILGRHLWLIMAVLVAFTWPGLAILVRSMVLQLRSGQLVEAARSMGASRTRIMARHVFPQVAPFIVAQMIFFAPGAILAEAALSFLGLGDPSAPTWGQMLEAGFRTGALYVGYWWWVLPPGILIVITALAFMLLALALEPIVDPRLRQTSS